MDMEKFSDSKPVVGIDPATALAATVTGNSIDTQNYRSLTLALDVVISAGSLDAVGFEESDDDSTWTTVDDSEVLYYPGTYPVDADSEIHIGCISKKQYVRPVLTCTTPTGTVAGIGFLQDSLFKPQVKESSVVADADVRNPDTTGDATTTAPKR